MKWRELDRDSYASTRPPRCVVQSAASSSEAPRVGLRLSLAVRELALLPLLLSAPSPDAMINFFLMMNKQGRTRLSKFYDCTPSADRAALEASAFHAAISREGFGTRVNGADPKHAEYKPFRGGLLVCQRYVGLWVIAHIATDDNPVLTHCAIHLFIEILDAFFGTVRELDVIYRFMTVYALLDEFICGGEVVCSDKAEILARVRDLEKARR